MSSLPLAARREFRALPTAAALSLLIAAAGLAQGPSPNLMLNSSFEFGPKSGGQPQDWEIVSVPAGGSYERDLGVAHSGKASLKLVVPDDAKMDWYQAAQEHSVRRAGEKFTLSVYIKAQGIHDGVGAYCSLGFYGADGKRISYDDAQTKVTGTGDWVRQTTTGAVPEHCATLKVILTLYGHGTVWFDDAQLELADAATAYQPSAADIDVAASLTTQVAEARAYLASHRIARHPGLDVAILKDSLPAVGAASSPEALAAALRKGGFHPQFLNSVELSNAALLSTDVLDLLVLPYGASFPARATKSLQAFLSGGGSFISMGGYAFDAPLIQARGKWYDQTRLPDVPGQHPVSIFDLEGPDALKGWGLGSFRSGEPKMALATDGAPQGKQYLQVTSTNLQRWDCITTPTVDPEKLPKDWSVTVFRARGDANTTKLAVEWHERDQSRWKTVIDLSPEWREYRIPHTSLKYWQDNPSVGRGGPTDHFRPANASGMMFGLAEDIAKSGGNYSFAIDDIRVEDDPLFAERMSAVQINTRFAPIRDAMFPKAEQIGVFDPSHPLEQVAYARALGDQRIVPTTIRLPERLIGYAATAMLGLNGHGFGPDRARIITLLQCFDRFDRPRGALGSIIHHYTGYYQGSSWAIFGSDNVDVFDARHPQMLAALPQIARNVTRKLYLHGTEAEYACYRPGETVKLQCEVSDFGILPQRATVTLAVHRYGAKQPLSARSFPVSLRFGETKHLEMTWRPPANADDVYLVRATVLDGMTGGTVDRAGGTVDRASRPAKTGETPVPPELDREENAVILWHDNVARSGLAPKIDATYFKIGGKPLFMMGNQNWWGQSGSVSARSPLKMLRDYGAMQDSGLHFSRCFLPWGDERSKRISDAWVYLAQRHKIVLFHTPNLFNSMDNDEQAKQEKWAREIGERYRDIPGLVVDTSNEPYFVLNDEPNLRAWWNEYLKAKYATDDALKAAWPLSPPEKPMLEVPCGEPSDKWADVRAADEYGFAMARQSEWARKLRGDFRAGDPELPISVGFMQGFGWRGAVWDPVNNSLDQDFTDRHYYGELAAVPAEIKEIDLRWMGKPMSIGECGAKPHPSYDPGNLGEDPETYLRRFLYIGHHTFGMGGAFMSSWHWRDPMEGIFPCGIVHADGVPRLAESAMRNMAILFSCIHPKYEPPQVFLLLPDTHRLSAQRDMVQRGFRRAIDLLIGLRVNFGTITEKSLAQLPASAKAIVYPIPYATSDATCEALRAFMARGGKLYLSGDISYDATFQRTKTDRLKTLCGVEFVSERYPNIALRASARDAAAVRVTTTTNATDLKAFDAHPGITVKAAGAEVLAEDADRAPVIVTNKVGEGGVLFAADPIELEARDTCPQREIYAHFLAWAGIGREALTPDDEAVHAFRMATEEGGQVHVLQNTGTATTVRLPDSAGAPALDMAQGLSGLVWQDKAGAVLAAEGQGAVQVGGRELARFRGHCAALSLDDAGIERSQALLILPFSAGSVEMSTSLPSTALVAEFGEIVQGGWRKLEVAPVRVAGRKLSVTVPAEHRTSMLLIAPRQTFDTYSGALAASVARR